MTDKDKIVDILDKMPTRRFGHAMHIEIANWLVANGVTVQKHGRWMSEKDGATMNAEEGGIGGGCKSVFETSAAI